MQILKDTTIIAALLAAFVTLIIYLFQRIKDMNVARDALFAELRHIHQHYTYASEELPQPQYTNELKKRLKYSLYGKVICVDNIAEYVILGAGEMQSLLQISFRIRNTDQFIEILLSNIEDISAADIDELKGRMSFVRSSADTLILYLQNKYSRLRLIPKLTPKNEKY
jgi:hypothetical protein